MRMEKRIVHRKERKLMKGEGERYCWYIDPSQDPEEHGGYVPSMVKENESGHYPMTGDPAKLQTPWIWGNTYDEAVATAKRENERLGLTEEDVTLIIVSSMRAGRF